LNFYATTKSWGELVEGGREAGREGGWEGGREGAMERER